MDFKIGHLNCHNNPKALAVAVGWGARSLGLNEVGKIRQRVSAVRDYVDFSIPGASIPQRTSLSTALLVRKEVETFGGIGMLLSDPSSPERIAPGRWLYGMIFDAGARVAHLEFHNHAVVDGKFEKVDRVAKHSEGLDDVELILRMIKKMEIGTVLTGDLNTRDDAPSPDWDDAGERFRDLNWEYEAVGLDWIAWDPDHLDLKNLKTISREQAHTDHPGLLAEMRTL